MIQREAMSTIVSPLASFVSHSILDYVILAFQLYQKTSYTYSKYRLVGLSIKSEEAALTGIYYYYRATDGKTT
jgi:hypothetical protein